MFSGLLLVCVMDLNKHLIFFRSMVWTDLFTCTCLIGDLLCVNLYINLLLHAGSCLLKGFGKLVKMEISQMSKLLLARLLM